MTISRQKLYSLGEPFGDSATERKVDGNYICGGGGGKGDNPPPPAPAPRPESAEAQAEVDATRQRERRRQAMAGGQQSTVMTGGQGLTAPAATTSKSLLGQ
jgi:hypothetical protein